MKTKIVLLIILLTPSLQSRAQIKDTNYDQSLIFELLLFDLPYQLDAAKTVNDGNVTFGSFLRGYANPSMHQSLDLSSDLYTASHWGIKELFEAGQNQKSGPWKIGKRALYALTLGVTDFVLTYAPGFNGWEHEEYHRAVLTRFHVNSFNDMNKFPLGANLINVSHVLDEDLVRFKLESPADFTRAHVAGIEGEYLLIDRLQRNNFYYIQNLPHELLYLFSTVNSILYVQICSDPYEADPLTDDSNAKEISVESRDFTGLDFLAWTYDLFRPQEDYTARGIHPSGTGIDRYIKTTDLTVDELSYLRKQGKLQWMNVVSPMLIGFKRIRLTENGLYGNFSLHHYLTSFGNDISCNFFLMNPYHKLFFAFHSYQNYVKSFPSIEAQIIDWVPALFSRMLYISPRLIIGMQPLNQEFKTSKSSFLGLAECRVELKSAYIINPFAEFSLKSQGWVAGNEFLGGNFSCRVGVSSRFHISE